jgi:uncharacterized repeat protein (TIGR01451 family)
LAFIIKACSQQNKEEKMTAHLVRLFLLAALLGGYSFGGPTAAISAGPSVSGVAAPSLVTIPEIPVNHPAPNVDGVCKASEYQDGISYNFTDGPNGTGIGTVYLLHGADTLYLCISSSQGTYATRFDSLYLDPQGDGNTYTFAQQDDFSFRLDFSGGKTSFRGNGSMGGWWNSSSSDNALWSGAALSVGTDVAEYALSLASFNIHLCTSIFALAGYHHHFAFSGNDYGWPSNQYYDQPGTWQLATLGGASCNPGADIAYVYRGDSASANSFQSLLTGAGYTVALVPLGDVLGTDFSTFEMVIIADDTGNLSEWGTAPTEITGSAQADHIAEGGRPILGLGEGGYAFFGRRSLYIGWPNGWHGPGNFASRATSAPATVFSGVPSDPVQLYIDPVNTVSDYLSIPDNPIPSDVTPIALEEPPDNHASIIQQDCKVLWGYSGNPDLMTSDPKGQRVFLNTVGFVDGLTCTASIPTPEICGYTLEKTANPTNFVLLDPGTVVEYTLTYHLISRAGCPTAAKLVDAIPAGTVFVPGSATGGISPGADGVLTWTVGISASELNKKFSVQVADSACTDNNLITNIGELRPTASVPLASTPVTHAVNCPPIELPHTGPMFAEDELQVDPYPLVAGHLHHVSVRLHNLTTDERTATVLFQVAPETTTLGTGLAYMTFATASTSLAPSGTAVLSAVYIPDHSGNRCFQVQVSSPGMSTPIVTQSCLDLNEDFHAGVSDDRTFTVRNDTSSSQTYTLVVDNVCPGWTAVVTPFTIDDLAAGGSRTATLTVTPPNPLTLGSGCHIDVQVWNGTTMVGGFRKLDFPPVHLPPNILPPWEEPEITVNPDPPVAGSPGHVCIQLQNPLAVSKTVTIHFSEADFGAGIPFTPIASLTDLVLPPHSLDSYCADWTPVESGTTHRCIMATLEQSGALDQNSQRNIDIIHPTSSDLGSLQIPFFVRNPGGADRELDFDINLVGINPYWTPFIQTPLGKLPPSFLPADTQVELVLTFQHLVVEISPLAPEYPEFYQYGSYSSVEVTELLDGIPEGGFTVRLDPLHIYLPLIVR